VQEEVVKDVLSHGPNKSLKFESRNGVNNPKMLCGWVGVYGGLSELYRKLLRKKINYTLNHT